jgi:hypothetical protein
MRAPLRAELLVDTGAETTLLGPQDAFRLDTASGIRLNAQPSGAAVGGIGGDMPVRRIEATLYLGGNVLHPFPAQAPLAVCEYWSIPASHRHYPSILGRDVLRRYALVVEERSGTVLLLEPAEAARLGLTRQP